MEEEIGVTGVENPEHQAAPETNLTERMQLHATSDVSIQAARHGAYQC